MNSNLLEKQTENAPQPLNETNENKMILQANEASVIKLTNTNGNESALEHLAKNIDAIGKYRELKEDVKINDMIAFKVMSPSFQPSEYIIGLVENFTGELSNMTFELSLLIMGKIFKSTPIQKL